MKRRFLLLLLASLTICGCDSLNGTPIDSGNVNPPINNNNDDSSNNNGNGEVIITSISVYSSPNSIFQNETLSATEVLLQVNYSNNSRNYFKAQSISLDTSTLGETTGTAFYESFSCNFTINVENPYAITGIVEVYQPESLQCGEEVDISLFSALVEYANGETATVPVDNVSVNTTYPNSNAFCTITVNGIDYYSHIKVVATYFDGKRGEFAFDSTSLSCEGNKVSTSLKTSDDSINVTIENATLDDGKIKGSANSCFVIYNNEDSALTSISNVQVDFSCASGSFEYANFNYAIYYSAHYLTLDNIMAGKYKDLHCQIGTKFVSSSNIYLSGARYTARYFLIVFSTLSYDLTIDNISVRATNENGPIESTIGEYALPENYKSYGSNFGFDDGIPYIGNGSVYFDTYTYRTPYEAFQPLANKDWLEQVLIDNGFHYACRNEGYLYYQKQIPNNSTRYYTLKYRATIYGDYVFITLVYDGDNPDWFQFESWPTEVINKTFDNEEFKSLIINPNLGGFVVYSPNDEKAVNKNYLSMYIHNKDSIEQFNENASKLKDFFNSFVTDHDYITIYSNGDNNSENSYYFNSNICSTDYRFNIELYISINNELSYATIRLLITEYKFGDYPIDVVREHSQDESAPILNNSYSFYDQLNGRLSITCVNVDDESFNSYLNSLVEDKYYIYTDKIEDGEHTYKLSKIFIASDHNSCDYVEYSITRYSDKHITIGISRYNSTFGESANNLLYKLYRGLDMEESLAESLANELGFTGPFVTESAAGLLHCLSNNESDIQKVKDACVYDEGMDKYLYYDETQPESHYCYAVEPYVEDGHLVIKITELVYYLWRYYYSGSFGNDVNSYIEDKFYSWDIRKDIETYYFDESDKCNVSIFNNYGFNYIYIFGKDANQIAHNYVSRIESSENVEYSTYYGLYVNKLNGLVLTDIEDHTDEYFPYAVIKFKTGYECRQYISYSQFKTDATNKFSYFNNFPSSHSITEELEAYYILSATQNELSFDMPRTLGEEYEELVKTLDYFKYMRVTENGSVIERYESVGSETGNRCLMSFNHSQNTTTITYHVDPEFYNKTISDLRNELNNKTLGHYIPLPNLGGKVVHIKTNEDSKMVFYFNPFECFEDEYALLLTNEGFVPVASGSPICKEFALRYCKK